MLSLDPNRARAEKQLEQQFTTVATSLSLLLQNEGLKTKAFMGELSYFKQLTESEKHVALEKLNFYYELCLEHVVENCSLRDSKRFTWRALVKLGLSPNSDLLERLEDGDIVEIYDSQQVQLFRNLEFFDFCSYTLEELFCLEWWRLFKRDEAISNTILRLVNEIYQRKHPNGVSDPFPPHLVVESLSRDKFNVDFYMKQISPLYRKRRVEGLICIERAALV